MCFYSAHVCPDVNEREDDLDGFIVPDEAELDVSMEEDHSYKIVSHWNIANYLPHDLLETFEGIVGEFVYSPIALRELR